MAFSRRAAGVIAMPPRLHFVRGMVHNAAIGATTPGVFSGFFVELSAATPLGALPDPDQLNDISTKYGITMLGPPMFQ